MIHITPCTQKETWTPPKPRPLACGKCSDSSILRLQTTLPDNIDGEPILSANPWGVCVANPSIRLLISSETERIAATERMVFPLFQAPWGPPDGSEVHRVPHSGPTPTSLDMGRPVKLRSLKVSCVALRARRSAVAFGRAVVHQGDVCPSEIVARSTMLSGERNTVPSFSIYFGIY